MSVGPPNRMDGCGIIRTRVAWFGGLGGRELVDAAEATIAACHEMTREQIG